MISRMWTVYSFVDKVLPILDDCTNVHKDLVKFLSPILARCSTFVCELMEPGEINEASYIELLIGKFLTPLIHNSCAVDEAELGQVPNQFVPTNSKVLRAKTLQT